MLTKHGRFWHQNVHPGVAWTCAVCNNYPECFDNPRDLESHMESTHDFTKSQLEAIVRQSEVPRRRAPSICPLCNFLVEGDTKTRSKAFNTERPANDDSAKRQCEQPGPYASASHNHNYGGTSADIQEPHDEELMARHVAAHLQGLMLLTIRLMAIHDDDAEMLSLASSSADSGDSSSRKFTLSDDPARETGLHRSVSDQRSESGVDGYENMENPAHIPDSINYVDWIDVVEDDRYRSTSHSVVPIRVVPSYIDRSELLSEIGRKLQVYHKNASVPHAVVIYGLGGSGKTQLVARLLEAFEQTRRYSPIVWIDGTDKTSVQSSFKQCAVMLGLEFDPDAKGSRLSDLEAVQSVLDWLRVRREEDKEWLFIINNAYDYGGDLLEILPKGNRGNIIITSRQYLGSALAPLDYEVVRVGSMSLIEGKALLLQHFGADPVAITEELEQQCEELTQKLGGLPLAIDLVGAYIANRPNPKQALALFSKELGRSHDASLRIEDAISMTFNISLEGIKSENGPQPDLLMSLLARFRGGFIQDEIFHLASLGMATVDARLRDETQEVLPADLRQFIEVRNGDWDPRTYQQCRDILARYHLLQRVEAKWTGVRMHGVIQDVAITKNAHILWEKCYILFILAACCQLLDGGEEPEFRRHLVGHLSYVDLRNTTIRISENLINFAKEMFGTAYYEEGRWNEAKELQEQVLDTEMGRLGESDPRTLGAMSNLSLTLQQLGKLEEAKQLQRNILETRLKTLGQDNPNTIHVMADLARTYQMQGRLDDAEKLQRQALELNIRILGEEHPNTIQGMADLARTYQIQGRLEEAEKLQRQVRELNVRILGEEHHRTLANLANLAVTYQQQGKLTDAEQLQLYLLDTRIRVIGEDHPETLTSMSNLASTYTEQGRLQESENLETRVLEERMKRLGEEHPETLVTMSNLAITIQRQGRQTEALEMMERCVQARQRVLGPEHPFTRMSVKALEEWAQSEA